MHSLTCGATCLMLLIVGGTIYSVNLGDCRAILSKKGRVVELSLDHTPDRQDEKERIEKNGGFV